MFDARSNSNKSGLNKPLKVMVCTVTLVAFLFNIIASDLAWAVRTPSELTSVGPDRAGSPGILKELNVRTFTLPESLGHIKDAWSANTKHPTIIHIQDAHCNYDAQRKIAEIIEYLNKEYGINTVNLEGGAKDYDLSVFTRIPDLKIREKVADNFVREGLVNGAEYFAINNPDKLMLWGMEDTKLYIDNLNAYRDSLKRKDEVEKNLKALRHILNNLKIHIYTKELLELDTRYGAYKAGNMEFKDYLDYLIQKAKDKAIDIKVLKDIYILAQTLGAESAINFKRANNERDELIDKLQRRLSKNSMEELVVKTVEFKAERISQKDFYGYLVNKAKSVNLDLSQFPELQRYIVYVAMYDAIDKARLMDELETLEARLKESMYQNDNDRQLSALSKNLILLVNIFNISLTKEDYKYYRDNEASFDMKNYISFINKEAPLYKITARPDSNIVNLDRYRQDLSKFYEYSLKRDQAFMRNIKLPSKVSIMVTGGFHTENLTELFKKNNISYVSIMPSFKNEDGYECPYFGLLAGEITGIEKRLYSVLSTMPASSIQIASHFTSLGSSVYGGQGVDSFELAVLILEALDAGEKEVLIHRGEGAKIYRVSRDTDGQIKIEDTKDPESIELTESPYITVTNDGMIVAHNYAGHNRFFDAQLAKARHEEMTTESEAIKMAIEFFRKIGKGYIADRLENLAHVGLINLAFGIKGFFGHAGGQGIHINGDIKDAREQAAILVHETIAYLFPNDAMQPKGLHLRSSAFERLFRISIRGALDKKLIASLPALPSEDLMPTRVLSTRRTGRDFAQAGKPPAAAPAASSVANIEKAGQDLVRLFKEVRVKLLKESHDQQDKTLEGRSVSLATKRVFSIIGKDMELFSLARRAAKNTKVVRILSSGSSYCNAVDMDNIYIGLTVSDEKALGVLGLSEAAKSTSSYYDTLASEVGHAMHDSCDLLVDGKIQRGVAEAYDLLARSLLVENIGDEKVRQEGKESLLKESFIGEMFLQFSKMKNMPIDEMSLTIQIDKATLKEFIYYVAEKADMSSVEKIVEELIFTAARDADYGIQHYVGAYILFTILKMNNYDLRLVAKKMGLALKNSDRVNFNDPNDYIDTLTNPSRWEKVVTGERPVSFIQKSVQIIVSWVKGIFARLYALWAIRMIKRDIRNNNLKGLGKGASEGKLAEERKNQFEEIMKNFALAIEVIDERKRKAIEEYINGKIPLSVFETLINIKSDKDDVFLKKIISNSQYTNYFKIFIPENYILESLANVYKRKGILRFAAYRIANLLSGIYWRGFKIRVLISIARIMRYFADTGKFTKVKIIGKIITGMSSFKKLSEMEYGTAVKVELIGAKLEDGFAKIGNRSIGIKVTEEMLCNDGDRIDNSGVIVQNNSGDFLIILNLKNDTPRAIIEVILEELIGKIRDGQTGEAKNKNLKEVEAEVVGAWNEEVSAKQQKTTSVLTDITPAEFIVPIEPHVEWHKEGPTTVIPLATAGQAASGSAIAPSAPIPSIAPDLMSYDNKKVPFTIRKLEGIEKDRILERDSPRLMKQVLLMVPLFIILNFIISLYLPADPLLLNIALGIIVTVAVFEANQINVGRFQANLLVYLIDGERNVFEYRGPVYDSHGREENGLHIIKGEKGPEKASDIINRLAKEHNLNALLLTACNGMGKVGPAHIPSIHSELNVFAWVIAFRIFVTRIKDADIFRIKGQWFYALPSGEEVELSKAITGNIIERRILDDSVHPPAAQAIGLVTPLVTAQSPQPTEGQIPEPAEEPAAAATPGTAIELKEKIVVMPDGRKLYISAPVQRKYKILEDMIKHKYFVAEILAFGFIKETSKGLELVDLVLPERVFDMERFFVEERHEELAKLIGSSGLRIEIDNDSMFLTNEKGQILFLDEFGFKLLGNLLNKLLFTADKPLPDYTSLKQYLKKHGPLYLNSDWDIVIRGNAINITNSYAQKVIARSKESSLEINFCTHFHPNFAISQLALRKASMEEREQRYDRILTPSEKDINTLLVNGIRWFEIKAFGTPIDPETKNETTSRWFDMNFFGHNIYIPTGSSVINPDILGWPDSGFRLNGLQGILNNPQLSDREKAEKIANYPGLYSDDLDELAKRVPQYAAIIKQAREVITAKTVSSPAAARSPEPAEEPGAVFSGQQEYKFSPEEIAKIKYVAGLFGELISAGESKDWEKFETAGNEIISKIRGDLPEGSPLWRFFRQFRAVNAGLNLDMPNKLGAAFNVLQLRRDRDPEAESEGSRDAIPQCLSAARETLRIINDVLARLGTDNSPAAAPAASLPALSAAGSEGKGPIEVKRKALIQQLKILANQESFRSQYGIANLGMDENELNKALSLLGPFSGEDILFVGERVSVMPLIMLLEGANRIVACDINPNTARLWNELFKKFEKDFMELGIDLKGKFIVDVRDAVSQGLPDGPFTRIVCVNVFNPQPRLAGSEPMQGITDFPSMQKVASEMNRVMAKEGGKIYYNVYVFNQASASAEEVERARQIDSEIKAEYAGDRFNIQRVTECLTWSYEHASPGQPAAILTVKPPLAAALGPEPAEGPDAAQPGTTTAITAAKPMYDSAKELVPIIVDLMNKDAPTYDLAPAIFEDISPTIDYLRRTERTLGRQGHDIHARHYKVGAGEDGLKNLKDQLEVLLPEFNSSVQKSRTARMTIRILSSGDRDNILHLIEDKLKELNTDKDGNVNEASAKIAMDRIHLIAENIRDVKHLNPLIDLFADIGMMEVDRYTQKDYIGTPTPEFLDNLAKLLKSSVTNLENITGQNLIEYLKKIFEGTVVLMIKAIDWQSIQEWKRSQDEVLRAL